ncbi:MAG: hypothetical protein GY757_52960 [bacterium]|nr:hypothetical protein [bacterium]
MSTNSLDYKKLANQLKKFAVLKRKFEKNLIEDEIKLFEKWYNLTPDQLQDKANNYSNLAKAEAASRSKKMKDDISKYVLGNPDEFKNTGLDNILKEFNYKKSKRGRVKQASPVI